MEESPQHLVSLDKLMDLVLQPVDPFLSQVDQFLLGWASFGWVVGYILFRGQFIRATFAKNIEFLLVHVDQIYELRRHSISLLCATFNM